MKDPPPSDATQILARIGEDEGSAAERLFELVYAELRALAASYLGRERPDHTLQPTALVHEAYLRLIDQKRADWKGRAHFMAVAAKVMRRILVDHARTKKAAKRGGARDRVTLDAAVAPTPERTVDLLALEEALTALGERDARTASVVEMRFFGGLTIAETAHVLGVGTTTVEDEWSIARAWLSRELSGDRGAS